MTSVLSLSEQLLYSTVRIETILKNGGISTGTGFFYRFADSGAEHIPAIVTNKHVIRGADKGKFVLTKRSEDGSPIVSEHFTIELSNFEDRWIQHPNPEVDLCAMPIAPLLYEATLNNILFFFIMIDQSLIPNEEELAELTALEDIVMIGYPNGIWDSVNNMPVIRRGITATHPNLNYNGRTEFMIDAACFPGSSGSPVFLYNIGSYTTKTKGTIIGPSRIKFLGVLYAGPQHIVAGKIQVVTIPTSEQPISLSGIPNNLGLVIKAQRLKEIDEIFRSMPSGA